MSLICLTSMSWFSFPALTPPIFCRCAVISFLHWLILASKVAILLRSFSIFLR